MSTSRKATKADENRSATQLTLLANGSSPPWHIDIDESAGPQDQFFAQIEGPAIHLYFELPSLQTINGALQFLRQPRSPCATSSTKDCSEPDESMQVGVLGSAFISLVWDNEYADRCFFKVCVSSAAPTLQLTLWGEEIRHLTEALSQVKQNLEEDGLL